MRTIHYFKPPECSFLLFDDTRDTLACIAKFNQMFNNDKIAKNRGLYAT